MTSQFGELVQNFELKRVRGAHKGHQLTPLITTNMSQPLVSVVGAVFELCDG